MEAACRKAAGHDPVARSSEQPKAPLDRARDRMALTGQWSPRQAMGRRWAIGCVALEVTQRCNLDCSACYLSESAEAVKDLPIEEIFRRIDGIFDHYGPHTDVQVTGGDPTLRPREELAAIVRYIRRKGMRPALFTNGIRATRDLLSQLADAGLIDVAFHVDLTQGRKGYRSEAELNAVRRTYIERARGLPLAVYFNTTVFDANFDQIPEVVALFVQESDVVRLASFQLQAQTGRGTLGKRGQAITLSSVAGQIERGAKTSLTFDAIHAGHARCNRYAMSLVANGTVHDLLDDAELVAAVLARSAHLQFDRQSRSRTIASFARLLLRNPGLVSTGSGWLIRKLWRMRSDLWASRGSANKLSFFVHDFMDACALEKERLDACVFIAATHEGPVSMCLHNARRDSFLLDPLRVRRADGDWFWDPVSGDLTRQKASPSIPRLEPRTAKGRTKQRAMSASGRERYSR